MKFINQSNTVIASQQKFENDLHIEHRKDLGVFLTNNISTIDKMLTIVNFKDDQILQKKILEPSCGNGVFIVRLLELLFDECNNAEIVSNYIESSIYFVDVDEKMIKTTQKNISRFFTNKFGREYTGNFNSFIFDYTQRLMPKYNDSLFDSVMEIPLAKLIGEIDYIIGNPPYVSLYGRRDRKKDEAQRVYYLNRYSQFPDSVKNGKINFVMLFIEQSIDLLKDDGKLCFIIDLAFFETAYEYTRKYLLEKTKILSIEYNIKDFEVASGQIILKIQKSKVINNLVRIYDAENHIEIEVEQSAWKNHRDQYRFRFNTCSINSKIIDKIKYKKCPTLKTLYPKKNLRTCVMLLDMENLFVFDKPKPELVEKIYPYYQGSKGLAAKYSKLYNTKYFHYNKKLQDKINDELKEELASKGIKNKKRLGFGEIIIYDYPKVYIRQSAKEIIASYDENPSSANNSLYVFSLRESSENSKLFLKFLCGLLNSDLITFYAQQLNIIRFSKGKQPQIKTSDLYSIPVPTDQVLQRRISELVEKIYCSKENNKYKDEINNLIFQYFNIDESEILKIKESNLLF